MTKIPPLNDIVGSDKILMSQNQEQLLSKYVEAGILF